ncbi:hypothetical protein [Streptomyces sp. DSM 15324]|uniref:hypothetical protein n=1 Tax=Streptomyces sp. DSM 15324 TaxID=1739111 RepID=UPI0007468018|nr:hypothetical protein [Streptomyces sp. DSM 15324]KUO13923.1 hypothetical protein AQJ58_02315 [Streptomyces sp. DSM 15324]
MLDGEEHWNATLAEILLSRKIGAAHVKLLGDLISVTAQLDMAAQRRQPAFGLDDIIEFDEKVGPLEEAYQSAWRAVDAAPDRERRAPELQRLATALTEAVEGIVDVARRRGIPVELHRFGDSEG